MVANEKKNDTNYTVKAKPWDRVMYLAWEEAKMSVQLKLMEPGTSGRGGEGAVKADHSGPGWWWRKSAMIWLSFAGEHFNCYVEDIYRRPREEAVRSRHFCLYIQANAYEAATYMLQQCFVKNILEEVNNLKHYLSS